MAGKKFTKEKNRNLPSGTSINTAMQSADLANETTELMSSLSGVSADELGMPELAPPQTATDLVDEQNQIVENLIDQGPSMAGTDTKKHAFVVMPYGQKKGRDGNIIDFDNIFDTLISPALTNQGFEPFRADEETVSGDIHTDMFQELLLADVVVADLSIHNANVFYELGVRHAFRKRGIVHIKAARLGVTEKLPFNVFNVRTITYTIAEDGKPDASRLQRNIENIEKVVRSTWDSNIDTVHSPIYNLLSGLAEPNRRSLTTPLATGFWRNYTDWQERVAIAQRRKFIGDILLLTDEISNPLIKEEAVGEVGRALRELGRHELALNEYRKGRAVNPKNRDFRREEARLLNALGRVDAAIVKLERLVEEEPDDTKSTRFLGGIYTNLWEDCWRQFYDRDERRKEAFHTFPWLIKSIDTYLNCFHSNLNVHEPGIKAYTLASILLDLADEYDDHDNPSADIARIREIINPLSSTLEFSLRNLRFPKQDDYWTLASLAEWNMVSGASELAVERAYQKALSCSRRKMNYLSGTNKRLTFCETLGFRVNRAAAAKRMVDAEIKRIESGSHSGVRKDYPEPESDVQAYLFAGHMIDDSSTETARFPAKRAQLAKKLVSEKLIELDANGNDHAFLSGAACGGDILFIESCIERNMTVHIQMPCDEARYIREYVIHDDWVERYYQLRTNRNVHFHYQKDRVGMPADNTDPYMRNIRWTLYCSLQLGIDRLRLIALWDGKSDTSGDGDGARVTSMVNQMRDIGGRVVHLNTTKLDTRPVAQPVTPADGVVA